MDLKSGYPYWIVKNGLLASFPALSRDVTCDVAVIGAGITAALIARELAEAGLDVVVLDKRDASWGSTSASTALIQYEVDPGLVGLVRSVGERSAVAVLRACEASISEIASIAKETPGSRFRPAESLYYASWPWHARSVIEEGELRRRHAFDVDILDRADAAKRFGIATSAALLTHVAGELDPYAMALGILRKLAQKGCGVFDRTEVKAIEPASRGVVLRTDRECSVRCSHAVVAAGYESQTFLGPRVARNHSTYAIVTEPIRDLPPWARKTLLWESQRPYLYLRNAGDGRLMVGGEDDLVDAPGKRDRAVPRKAQRLIGKVRKLLGREDIEIGFAWAGTFAETRDGLPFFGPHPQLGPRVHFAMAYGGNGIVYSALGAALIRRRIARQPHPLARVLSFERL